MWHINAPIAQLVEHRTLNPQVVGSIPTGGTNIKRALTALFILVQAGRNCLLLEINFVLFAIYL